MSSATDSPQPQIPPQALISLRGITRRFINGDLEVEVLHGIDLDIYPGEFVAIIGASGSGKSTLMNIIGCLDRPSDGQYHFMGQNVSTLGRDELARLRREDFGFVFQSYNLIATASATENVEVPAIYSGTPPEERHARAHALLQELGLGERLNYRPSQLSGGQQQRVSIARALMNGGRIILADEPTGALDSKSGADVMKLLSRLSEQGHTIILITHAREVADHAHRVIEIRDGTILSDPGSMPQENTPDFTSPPNHNNYISDAIEATKTALRALRANVFRTTLTLLGIVIGVASVIAMMAIGDGSTQSIVDSISAMGSNLLTVRPGAPNQRGRSTTATLIPEDVVALRDTPNILAVVPEQGASVTLRYGNIDHRTEINGTSYEYPIARTWPMASGTFFTEEDEVRYAAIAVLGQTVAKALFPDTDPLGQFVLVNNIPFQVIGLLSPKGATGWGQDQDDAVFIPYTTAGLRITGQTFLRNITVAVDDIAQIDATQEAIREQLLTRHGGVEDFQIRNMASIIESVSATQNTMTILLGSIAAISLLVGGIGVMNIMLVSVTERTREIGIRMATGARMRNILQQFLIEALAVSALGGLIGVIIGLGTASVIAALGTPIKYSLTPTLLAFGCAFATGLVFGYLPARKAARLDPVVALSSE